MAAITDFHAKYFDFELTKRSASDSMQKLASTLVDAQVDLYPHQVEAGLFAFRSPVSKAVQKTTNTLFPEVRQFLRDLGFKVIKLSPSNFKVWEAYAANDPEVVQGKLFDYTSHLSPEAKQEAILYELLLKSGFELTTAIATLKLADNTVYRIADGELLICLDRQLTLEVLKAMAELQPSRVICLDEDFVGADADAVKTNAVQIMKSKGFLNFRTV